MGNAFCFTTPYFIYGCRHHRKKISPKISRQCHSRGDNNHIRTNFCSFTLLSRSLFTNDYSYLTTIEETIDINFPDTGKISTQNLSKGKQTTSDGSYIYSRSVVKFTDEDEIKTFHSEITNSDKWIREIDNTKKKMLADYASIFISDYDYFMIYNRSNNSYNTLPNQSGEYEYILIAYNPSKATMMIIEYKKTMDVSELNI